MRITSDEKRSNEGVNHKRWGGEEKEYTSPGATFILMLVASIGGFSGILSDAVASHPSEAITGTCVVVGIGSLWIAYLSILYFKSVHVGMKAAQTTKEKRK
jgi:protein-S-isoprenylcysteine O-methyltransferase Ste14